MCEIFKYVLFVVNYFTSTVFVCICNLLAVCFFSFRLVIFIFVFTLTHAHQKLVKKKMIRKIYVLNC